MILLIYGAGGLAKEVYDLIMRSMPNRWEIIYFIDDFREEGSFYLSKSIKFESVSKLFRNKIEDVEGIVAVGEPANREVLTRRMEEVGIHMATIVDKTALISPTAVIEEGSIICEMATVHANVRIGKGVLIQPFASIGHDIVIGNYSVMGPHCAPGGEDAIGEKVYIGMHTTLKEKITIGDEAVVGMGAVVYRDVEAKTTVLGNPARVTKGNNEHRVFSS